MTSFSEWLNIKEDAGPTAGNIALKGQLGKRGSGINLLNRRMEQPLQGMTDQTRITYMANMIAAVYNNVPPEHRMKQFIKDFTFLRPKIVAAIRQSQRVAPDSDAPPQGGPVQP